MTSVGACYFFGSYRLDSQQFRLYRDDTVVALGGRAFDLLLALIRRAGEVVSKRELIEVVWPTTVVDESNLRGQIAALRLALGDSGEGQNMLATVPGRGYRFIAPVTHALTQEPGDTMLARRLPAYADKLHGRDTDVRRVAETLVLRRFVTVSGPGGIGKTRLAVEVARQLQDTFAGGARFVDLSEAATLADVRDAIAASCGLPLSSRASADDIALQLATQQALLLIDSCERVTDMVAHIVERSLSVGARGAFLISSREALRAEGEHVFRIGGLSVPDAGTLDHAALSASPALRMFVDHAVARRHDFRLDDSEVPLLADLCRHIEGSPFVIELLAGHVEAFGVGGLCALAQQPRQLLDLSRRVPVERHSSLRMLIEWQRDLLADPERTLLKRFAAWRGDFTLTDACAMAAEAAVQGELQACARPCPPDCVAAAIGRLVNQSRLIAECSRGFVRYRVPTFERAFLSSADSDFQGVHAVQAHAAVPASPEPAAMTIMASPAMRHSAHGATQIASFAGGLASRWTASVLHRTAEDWLHPPHVARNYIDGSKTSDACALRLHIEKRGD
ncbi:putative ATPase [Paraburkholderia sp. CI2]|uniref:ATP-binding protein n=1 Tax=unclassified Paraburkholderia TaxID=2615204 RepID=UPI00162185DD|nr:winged helix-turn-helix domain-containing protein [Paraburkholderia sp. CI2]MBB5466806.1 putative ATPase [Paraburkholderia sp. CI2]